MVTALLLDKEPDSSMIIQPGKQPNPPVKSALFGDYPGFLEGHGLGRDRLLKEGVSGHVPCTSGGIEARTQLFWSDYADDTLSVATSKLAPMP